MAFSVPLLLEVSIAVVHRLNVAATKNVKPYAGQTTGYDKDFREPITYNATRQGVVVRDNARIEYPPVRIRCQVEPIDHEALKQLPPGNVPDSSFWLVFHRQDLKRLQLIDPQTKAVLLKVNDRVSAIESYQRKGVPTVALESPGLYIWEIRPASFGFGSDGYDLHIVSLNSRERAK